MEICSSARSFVKLYELTTTVRSLPGKGDLVLRGAFPGSVEAVAIPTVLVYTGHVDWPHAIARISNQDGDDVTRCLLNADWWGVERLSFYIVSQSHWRAQLGYVSTRDTSLNT